MARKKVPHNAKAKGAKQQGEESSLQNSAPVSTKQDSPSQAQKAAAPKTHVKESGKDNPLTRFAKYVEEARAELRKVSWPTFPETRKATLVVLAFVTVMSILLGLVDLGLSSLIQLMLS